MLRAVKCPLDIGLSSGGTTSPTTTSQELKNKVVIPLMEKVEESSGDEEGEEGEQTSSTKMSCGACSPSLAIDSSFTLADAKSFTRVAVRLSDAALSTLVDSFLHEFLKEFQTFTEQVTTPEQRAMFVETALPVRAGSSSSQNKKNQHNKAVEENQDCLQDFDEIAPTVITDLLAKDNLVSQAETFLYLGIPEDAGSDNISLLKAVISSTIVSENPKRQRHKTPTSTITTTAPAASGKSEGKTTAPRMRPLSLKAVAEVVRCSRLPIVEDIVVRLSERLRAAEFLKSEKGNLVFQHFRLRQLLEMYLTDLLSNSFFVRYLKTHRSRCCAASGMNGYQAWKTLDAFYVKHLVNTVFLPRQIQRARELHAKAVKAGDEGMAALEIKFSLRKTARVIELGITRDESSSQISFQLVENFPLGALAEASPSLGLGGGAGGSSFGQQGSGFSNSTSNTNMMLHYSPRTGAGAQQSGSSTASPVQLVKMEANWSLLDGAGGTASAIGVLGIPAAKCRKWEIAARADADSTCLFPELVMNSWLANISSHFDGVEDCMICYSVIDTKTGELPRKACPTCKNVFHARCLQKWFMSSAKTKCPLCKQDWVK
ncbi:unnamed protein product [Amoebophrya sp. A25]|nr:unnamed protein product [Amoebophrya sp. A25]|eukprot:GSA25T00017756001.1